MSQVEGPPGVDQEPSVTAVAERTAYGDPVEHLEFYVGKLGALVPMIAFVIGAIALCLAAADKGAPDESGLILIMVIGLVLGMFLCRSPWADYCQAIFDGMAQPVGVIAVVCWVWAGMFAMVLRAGGLVKGLVWLGAATGFTGSLFAFATFLLSAVFASAVGTGYGTTVAFCTLMYPAGIILGADPVILFAAILSGSAFGDNLAPVSDTTIVSAVTQETDVPGVVRSRFKYAVIAAIPAALGFLLLGSARAGALDATAPQALLDGVSPAGLILLLPFGLVIALALTGRHIIVAITAGILAAVAILGIASLPGLSDLHDLPGLGAILRFDTAGSTPRLAGALVSGIEGFLKLSILILFIVAAGHIMRLGGALDSIKRQILRLVGRSVRRAELSIFALVAALNVFITVNTAAEIAAAPFVSDVGKEFGIHPYRRANLLDAVTSALGYIFPWSGGVLIGVSTLNELHTTGYPWLPVPSPTTVWPFVLHGWLLALVMLGAALTGWGRRYSGPDGRPVKIPPGSKAPG